MPRVIRTSKTIFRITCLGVAICIVNTSVALALQTIKTSSFALEGKQGLKSSLAHPSPQFRQNKKARIPNIHCLALLSSSAPLKHGYKTVRRLEPSNVPSGNVAVPVALSLFFGAHLPPTARETLHKKSNSSALAVAAYRQCEKETLLKAHRQNSL